MKILQFFLKWVVPCILLSAFVYGISLAGIALYKKATFVSPDGIVRCMATSTVPAFTSDCLHSTVGKLLGEYPVSVIQAYTVATSSPTSVTTNCHAIGHIIGEELYAKTGSVEGSLSLCTSMCAAACLHGALGAGVLEQLGTSYADFDIAHADTKDIAKIGTQYCDRSISLCHGIGHILYLLDGDKPEGFETCTHISEGFAREACYQGIYMERSGGKESLNPFQATTTYAGHKDDYTFPCSSIAEQYRHACFQFLSQFQRPLFTKAGIVGPAARLAKATEICKSLSGHDRSYCFEGIGITAQIFVRGPLTEESVSHLCDLMPGVEDRNSCTLGIIPRDFFLGGHGFGYCGDIKEAQRQSLCFNAAFTWMNSSPKSDADMIRICTSAGASDCTERFNVFTQAKSTLPDYRFGLFGDI